MQEAYVAIERWLDCNDHGYMEDDFPEVLRPILECTTSVRIGDVVSNIGEIANLTEGRFRMPLLSWPWLEDRDTVRDKYYLYTAMSDVLDRTRNSHMHVYGNNYRLHSGSDTVKKHFFAKNEDWNVEAVPGLFEKWYSGGTGKGLTLTRVMDKDDPGYNHIIDGEIRGKLEYSGSRKCQRYKTVRPEIAITCAFAPNHKSMLRLATSNIISMAFLQAVRVSRGTSDVSCDMEVIRTCTSLPHDTVGGQIGILAAIYSRLMSCQEDQEALRGKLGVLSGLGSISLMKLSNNLYWLKNLVGSAVDTSIDVASADGKRAVMFSKRCAIRRRKRNIISARQNSLVVRDVWRTLIWYLISLLVLAMVAISVAFQDIDNFEKLEKSLNLLFTVLIATAIGLASIHTEENLLGNVMNFRRRISDVSDFSDELFLDVINYIEKEQRKWEHGNGVDIGRFISAEHSSWVSEYNRGETTLGRPVLLPELQHSYISISSRLELCLCTDEVRRNLLINGSGTCKVQGPTAATNESKIFLTAPVRIG